MGTTHVTPSTAGSAKPALGRAFSRLPLGGSRTNVQCDGNGTSGEGERVRILCVRDFDTPDGYAANKSPLDAWRLR